MALWLVLLLLIVLHREILFGIVSWASESKDYLTPKSDVRLKAFLRQAPSVKVMRAPLLEILALPFGLKKVLFVNIDVWNRLNEKEQEAVLIWAHTAIERDFLFSRLLGFTDFRKYDRDVLVTATDPLSLSTALEKLVTARAERPPTGFGTLISGASLLGPPLIGEGIAIKERIKAYVDQLTRLKK